MRDQLDLPGRPPLFLDDMSNASRTWAKVGAWLAAGVNSLRHPFHWPVVTTLGADGFPESRVVVLRRFDSVTREAVFHTDVRSPKATDLRRDPRCGFLFYDPDQRLQVRLRSTVTLHHADEAAHREFDALPPHTRASYAANTPPGAELSPDARFDYPPRPPVDEAMAFGHFLVVVCRIHEVDALELHEHGHRRAKLWWDEAGVKMKRVAP